MAQISLTLPSDGTTIEAADVNNPFNSILNEFNGNIDDNNIKSGANINGTKLLANSIAPVSLDANSRAGWRTGIMSAPNTVTALGNRSYSLVFNTTDLTGYLSAGMRLRTTRTTAAPNQCTTLNGSTQYWVKSSPNKMTFTDDFTVSAWVKLTAYSATDQSIVSKWNGTSGWRFSVDASSGQFTLWGYNAGSANFNCVRSYQSIPLNKWVHVAAQLDMSTAGTSTTTSYTMMDGVDIPCAKLTGGTAPTALISAGNLEIGADNAGTRPFTGKIAQVAVYNAKVTQATILASMHQTLTGSESSLASAYSFSNSVTDLNTTTPNDLSVGGGAAVATTADSPYGTQADGTISTTLDYGIIMKTAFSTNTTLTVQVPEGCTIPTSGGVTSIAYSEHKMPYGLPAYTDKWRLQSLYRTTTTVTSNATYGTFSSGGWALTAPIGAWNMGYQSDLYSSVNTLSLYFNLSAGSALSGLTASLGNAASPFSTRSRSGAAAETNWHQTAVAPQTLSSATVYTMYTLGATTGAGVDGSAGLSEIFAENAYL